jgi:hypothetical protein
VAEVLTGILDHLVTLLEGTATSITRSVPERRFEHVPFEVEAALANSAEGPYPFEVQVIRTTPRELNCAGDHQYFTADVQIRIGYAQALHDQADRQDDLLEDQRVILRCLTDPDSWTGALTYFCGCKVSDANILRSVPIPGSTGEAEAYLHILIVDLAIEYREVMTT